MRTVTLREGTLAVETRGAGTPLVLLHGFPLNHSMWHAQLDALSARCQVIAPDLRGFGRSAAPADAAPLDVATGGALNGCAATGGAVSMERFADDVADLLDALGIREPVVLCGLSMGGYIAFQFARRHASRLRGLILCDTKAAPDSAEAVAARHATAEQVLRDGPAALAETMLSRLFSRKTLAERPSVIESVRSMMLGTKPEGIAAALRGMAARPDSGPLLKEIGVPTLLICGNEDKITPPAEMKSMAEAIPGAAYVEVADAGHMAPTEDPAAVNLAINAFLDRLA